MAKRRNNRRFITIGVTTLLMVFMVLCLLTFAVLSLVSAQADRKMSEKAAQRTSHYYDAENSANVLLKKIDEYLLEQYNKSKDETEWTQSLKGISDEIGETISADQAEDEMRLSFSVPIENEQELLVELRASYDTYEGEMYRITQWKVTDQAEWEADALPVLQ